MYLINQVLLFYIVFTIQYFYIHFKGVQSYNAVLFASILINSMVNTSISTQIPPRISPWGKRLTSNLSVYYCSAIAACEGCHFRRVVWKIFPKAIFSKHWPYWPFNGSFFTIYLFHHRVKYFLYFRLFHFQLNLVGLMVVLLHDFLLYEEVQMQVY